MQPLTTQQLIIAVDALDLSDPNRPISSRSQWQSDVWYFDEPRIGAMPHSSAIWWPTDASPKIVDMLKKIVWTAIVVPHGRPTKPATVAQCSTGITMLARFMTRWDYTDFMEFDATAVKLLLGQLKIEAARVDAEAYDDAEDEEVFEDDSDETAITVAIDEVLKPVDQVRPATDLPGRILFDGQLTFVSVYILFRTIALAYRQRDALRSHDVHIPEEDPLEGKTPYHWALEVRQPLETKKHALPDEIALPFMIAIDRLLGLPADDVIGLQRSVYAQFAPRCNKGWTGTPEEKTAQAFRFSLLPGENEPWHPNLPIKTGEGSTVPISRTIKELVVAIGDAAVLHLLQLTGMRMSEIVSLRAGWNPETGLPSCVRRVPSASNRLDLFYAVGTVSKGRQVPDNEQWLIGSAPRYSDFVPTTVRAIEVLQKVFEPWRTLSSDPIILGALLSSSGSAGLPHGSRGVSSPRAFTSAAAPSSDAEAVSSSPTFALWLP